MHRSPTQRAATSAETAPAQRPAETTPSRRPPDETAPSRTAPTDAAPTDAAPPENAPTENAPQREQRFERLVALSADFYWEQDAQFRFTFVRHDHPDRRAEALARRLHGRTPWELGGTPLNTTWEAHKAALAARRPFSNLLLETVDADGSVRYFRVTGQPIFADGVFTGYCGITRDVTHETRRHRLERTVLHLLDRTENFRAALHASLEAICESEGWEAGHFWRLDAKAGAMRLDIGWSVARAHIEDLEHETRELEFGRGIGLVGHVWQTGEPLWVPDLSREPRVLRKQLPERSGWHSALLFPVVSGEDVIGVLDFNAPSIPEPDEQLLDIFRLLGMQIGSAHERACALEQLRHSEELYASTFELAAIGIAHVAPDGTLIHANTRLCEMLGYSHEALSQLTIRDISHPEDIETTREPRNDLYEGRLRSFNVEKRYLRRDGGVMWARLSVALKRDDAGTPLYDISVVEDISERKQAEEHASYLAAHDELTGLTNRAAFGELLHHEVEAALRNGRRGAVLVVDLDRFSIINDSLGHAAGDRLLTEAASRLVHSVRRADVVARFGGDEFVVLLDNVEHREQTATVARKLLGALLEPVVLDGQECRITASIGIAHFPEDGRDAATLMRHADAAMYLAKEEGKNNFQFYSADVGVRSFERLNLESRLRQALERDELDFYYQPKVDLATGRMTGAEALIRWWNRELGAVSPTQFIPVAEEIGLIDEIGRHALETACRCNVEWQRRGLAPLVMAVNVSPRQFRNPRLIDDIAAVLEATGMDPQLLELEITESMILGNTGESLERMRAMKALGIRFAIDDFGTGYSSLAQLKDFPIDTLKIDRSFVRELEANARDRAITEAVISMGRALGVTVVAEGVETAAQLEFLRAHGCEQGQGFYFSPPVPAAACAALLDEGRAPELSHAGASA